MRRPKGLSSCHKPGAGRHGNSRRRLAVRRALERIVLSVGFVAAFASLVAATVPPTEPNSGIPRHVVPAPGSVVSAATVSMPGCAAADVIAGMPSPFGGNCPRSHTMRVPGPDETLPGSRWTVGPVRFTKAAGLSRAGTESQYDGTEGDEK